VNRDQALELLPLYAGDDLDDEERGAVRAALTEHPGLREELAAFEALEALLTRELAVDPAWAASTDADRPARRGSPAPRPATAPSMTWALVAAALLLASGVGLGALFGVQPSSAPGPGDQGVRRERATTSARSLLEVVLAAQRRQRFSGPLTADGGPQYAASLSELAERDPEVRAHLDAGQAWSELYTVVVGRSDQDPGDGFFAVATPRADAQELPILFVNHRGAVREVPASFEVDPTTCRVLEVRQPAPAPALPSPDPLAPPRGGPDRAPPPAPPTSPPPPPPVEPARPPSQPLPDAFALPDPLLVTLLANDEEGARLRVSGTVAQLPAGTRLLVELLAAGDCVAVFRVQVGEGTYTADWSATARLAPRCYEVRLRLVLASQPAPLRRWLATEFGLPANHEEILGTESLAVGSPEEQRRFARRQLTTLIELLEQAERGLRALGDPGTPADLRERAEAAWIEIAQGADALREGLLGALRPTAHEALSQAHALSRRLTRAGPGQDPQAQEPRVAQALRELAEEARSARTELQRLDQE
jgi:hypothetical protein